VLEDGDRVEIGSYRLQYRTRLAPKPAAAVPLEYSATAMNPVSNPAAATPASAARTVPELVLVDAFGTRHRLRPATNAIGRDPESDVPLTWDPTVSRRHAKIEMAGGEPVLTDLSSSNGTFVNGERLDGPRAIREGDELRLGKCVLRVERSQAR